MRDKSGRGDDQSADQKPDASMKCRCGEAVCSKRPHGGLVQIEIAQRLFDRPVFCFLQTFGEFSGQQIFFRFFCFD
jgi:hypothetical protein